jgi:threonylcarbamoyladenosine tRNA methylthiotransferase MtaB
MGTARVASIITLGCKLNLADSAEIARGLEAQGYAVIDRLCEADAYVLNTCSVTHVADQKSRRLIRAARRMAPGARVAVTGCYPQTAGEARVVELGADLVVGTRDADKQRIIEFLGKGGAPRRHPGGDPSQTLTRAFVKAQEGCNDVCAFCIVPRTRHREESRTIERVVDEVRTAVDAGAREVVITGTQLGAWGRDFAQPLTPDRLIAGILHATDVARLRFSSLQPQDITPQLLAVWQDPRVMPHFHLALQSGSPGVLRAMRRRYTAEEYSAAVERIEAAVPGVAITTDVIVGFPGESDEDFELTLDICRRVGFSRIHAFPYSTRNGTSAALLPGQVPHETKRARMAALIELGRTLGAGYHARFAGTARPVLWEQESEVEGVPYWRGYTDNYIPVYASGDRMRNRITPALLDGPLGDGVLGRALGVTI